MTYISAFNDPVIYLVEPDRYQRDALTSLFRKTGFEARSVSTAEELLQLQGFPAQASCVVSELNLPGLDGLGLLNTLRATNQTLPFVMLAGDADIGVAVTALHNKVSDYIVKPIVERDLVRRIQTVLRACKNKPAE